MNNKLHLEIEIKSKDLPNLRKFLNEVEGFEKFYPLDKSTGPESLIGADLWFKSIGGKRKKKLRKSIEAKHATITVEYSEDADRFSKQTQKSIRNSLIYFCITYFASISGISLIAPGVGVPLETLDTFFMGIPAGLGAFFSRLAIEFRI